MELTLVATFVLVPLFIGMVDFGKVYYTSIEVNNAAIAGVSYGAQTSTNYTDLTGMQSAATNDAANVTGMTTTSDYRICTDSSGVPSGCKTNCIAAGNCPSTPNSIFVDVTTQVTVHELLTNKAITLNGAATMRTQ